MASVQCILRPLCLLVRLFVCLVEFLFGLFVFVGLFVRPLKIYARASKHVVVGLPTDPSLIDGIIPVDQTNPEILSTMDAKSQGLWIVG